MVRRGRLGGEDVETGTGNPPFIERPRKHGFIDERTAAGVDQKRGRFHRGEKLLVHEIFCLWRERTVV